MKKVISVIVILLIGILIGFGGGVMVGMYVAQQDAGKVLPETGMTSPTVTSKPSSTITSMPSSTATSTPVSEGVGMLEPTVTNMPAPTATSIPKLPATSTPKPTAMSTPKPTATSTPQPTATSTPQPTVTSTPQPTATSTPQLTVTSTPQPIVTSTPFPTATSTPQPTATSTPQPSATSTPLPTPTTVPTDNLENLSTVFPGALHVEGTHLATADGTLVQLRGISTHGLGWFPDYVNEGMITQAGQEWGCNVFRLAMYTAEYNGYCTSGSSQKNNLKNIIDIGVKAAVEQNMYIIIDWHILSDSNPNIYKEEAKKFFAEMAKKYADVPNVIYEICNEPNGGTSWSTIKQYALEIIPVIREYAPEAVIIVGTPTWSQDVDIAAQDPITEYDNIMYALHFYAATHKEGLREKCKTAVAKGLPLFVTEYGICDASGSGGIDEGQADQWIALLDSYGISHVMWNLSNKAETSAIIKSSCNKKNNLDATDLSPAGTWFVAMMKEAGLGSEDWVMPEEGNLEDSGQNLGENPGGSSGENTGNGAATENGDNETPSGKENQDVSQTTGQTTVVSVPKVEDIFEVPDNVEISISGSWPSGAGYGIQFNVVVKNTGAVEETDWMRELAIKDGVEISLSQCWCAKVSLKDNVLVLKPEDYNKTVPAGGEVSGIGMILEVHSFGME